MTDIDRMQHKSAYKLAAVALWNANELIQCCALPPDIKWAKRIRRQAGRILCAVGKTDTALQDSMRRYGADVDAFLSESD